MESSVKNLKTEHGEDKLFKGDGLRFLFLALLYIVQGFAMGFLWITMPIILKKKFTYSEIGVISWWCIPYTIKFLFAPFVDTYFIKLLGKKRSWILPTQILLPQYSLFILLLNS